MIVLRLLTCAISNLALEAIEKAPDVSRNSARSVYQRARKKVDSSKDHFKDLVMRMLGDKDHEKVLYIVCKALSTCDAIFVIGGVIFRLTVLIGSPVIPIRLPYQTSRLCSDRISVSNVDRHCVLYVCFPQ